MIHTYRPLTSNLYLFDYLVVCFRKAKYLEKDVSAYCNTYPIRFAEEADYPIKNFFICTDWFGS